MLQPRRALLALPTSAALLLIAVGTAACDRTSGSEGSADRAPHARVAPDAASLCASQATADALKREIFHSAGEARHQQEGYGRLADIAYLRVDRPILKGTDEKFHRSDCSGTVIVSLPPGVTSSDGATMVSAEIDYSVYPAADGSGRVVRLKNGGAITDLLGKLQAREGARGGGESADRNASSAQSKEGAESPAVAPQSSSCRSATTDAEARACADPELSRLDRNLAAQFTDAGSRADSTQRRLLDLTQIRFRSRLEQCASNQCIANAYRSRSREISDIMSGKWRG